MRSNVGFVVLSDLFMLLFFAMAFFHLESRPSIIIEDGNPLNTWDGIFVVRKTEGGLDQAYIGDKWVSISVDHGAAMNRSLPFLGCSEICDHPRYESENAAKRLHIGGELGFRVAKIFATCSGSENCASLKLRISHGKLYCGEAECR